MSYQYIKPLELKKLYSAVPFLEGIANLSEDPLPCCDLPIANPDDILFEEHSDLLNEETPIAYEPPIDREIVDEEPDAEVITDPIVDELPEDIDLVSIIEFVDEEPDAEVIADPIFSMLPGMPPKGINPENILEKIFDESETGEWSDEILYTTMDHSIDVVTRNLSIETQDTNITVSQGINNQFDIEEDNNESIELSDFELPQIDKQTTDNTELFTIQSPELLPIENSIGIVNEHSSSVESDFLPSVFSEKDIQSYKIDDTDIVITEEDYVESFDTTPAKISDQIYNTKEALVEAAFVASVSKNKSKID
jgi:hypothetical protein